MMMVIMLYGNRFNNAYKSVYIYNIYVKDFYNKNTIMCKWKIDINGL